MIARITLLKCQRYLAKKLIGDLYRVFNIKILKFKSPKMGKICTKTNRAYSNIVQLKLNI